MTPNEERAIDAAFPLKTGRHDLWAEAMRLVGERHEKGDLVELVNWLLFRNDESEKSLADARSKHTDTLQYWAGRIHSDEDVMAIYEARIAELKATLTESERARTEAETERAWYRRIAHNNGGELFDKLNAEKRRADRAEAALTEEREAHRCSIADNNRLIAELAEERTKQTEADRFYRHALDVQASWVDAHTNVAALLVTERRRCDELRSELAEERAKREEAERQRDVYEIGMASLEKRAETAEVALATEYAARGDDIKRLSAELEEERAKSRNLVQQNVAQGRDRDSWRARAEAAELAALQSDDRNALNLEASEVSFFAMRDRAETAERERDEARLERQNADEQRALAVRMLDEERARREAAEEIIRGRCKPLHDSPYRRLLNSELAKLQSQCDSREYLFWWDMGSALLTLAEERREVVRLEAEKDGLATDCADEHERAETAEARIAELQAMVDVVTSFDFGFFRASWIEGTREPALWRVEDPCNEVQRDLSKAEAIALVRKCDAERET